MTMSAGRLSSHGSPEFPGWDSNSPEAPFEVRALRFKPSVRFDDTGWEERSNECTSHEL